MTIPEIHQQRGQLTGGGRSRRIEDQMTEPEIHRPFSDDGVIYCGWWTGDRIVNGCGELYPCLYLRSTPNALALATTPAPPLALGCGICNGLPGNSGCPACQGTGRVLPPAPAPRPVVDREAVLAILDRVGLTSGRSYTRQEMASYRSDLATAILSLLPTEEDTKGAGS
jgi:hypothetical protein